MYEKISEEETRQEKVKKSKTKSYLKSTIGFVPIKNYLQSMKRQQRKIITFSSAKISRCWN